MREMQLKVFMKELLTKNLINKPENPFQSYDLAKNLLKVQKPKTEQITIGRTNLIIFY